MKKIILIAMFISSLFAAGENLPDAKIISTTDCTGINLKVNFKTNSSQIEPQSFAKIEDFAEYMKSHPEKSADIIGYTDSRGNDDYNLALSKRRATAVYKQLIKDGVAASRLTHAGYGEANPIASNKTAQGQRENRRIEAVLH